MRQSSLFVASVSLIAFAVVVALGVSSLAPTKKKVDPLATNTSNSLPLVTPTISFANPSRGAASPKLTIVDFGDYSCEPCQTMERALATVLTKYSTDVRVVWKDFPNASLHKDAVASAVAARCANDQGKFWEYHDILFSTVGEKDHNVLVQLADSVDLDTTSFRACLMTDATKPLVERDFEEGQRLRIDATPTLFIGDRRISGALSAEQLEGFVIAELAKVNAGQK